MNFSFNKFILNKWDAKWELAADMMFVMLIFIEHLMENIWEVEQHL